MHRIVIVGGGAGGIELATKLGNRLGRSGRAHVTLVDRSPTHIWKPLLHEVAAGSLDTHAHQIAYTAHAHWNHFSFQQGEITGLDRSAKEVKIGPVVETTGGESEQVLPSRSIQYDTLVLALGSRTHFFGVPGAEQHAIALDSLQQAERLRRRLLQICLRKSAPTSNIGDSAVSIAIIGAGATGVELAAELRRMEDCLRQFGVLPQGSLKMRITLLEAGNRILPGLPARISDSTQAALEDMGISISLSKAVTEVEANGVKLADGGKIAADIVVWAAGIRAPEVLGSLDGIGLNRIGQVNVSRSLQCETDDNIFALGDCASCVWVGERMVPPRAQAAHQQAIFLSKALSARIKGKPLGVFLYKDHGSLISLGSSTAVGSLSGVSKKKVFVKGFLAGVMYAALYQKHLMAVSGLRRALLAVVAQGLGRVLSPRVKLH